MSSFGSSSAVRMRSSLSLSGAESCQSREVVQSVSHFAPDFLTVAVYSLLKSCLISAPSICLNASVGVTAAQRRQIGNFCQTI